MGEGGMAVLLPELTSEGTELDKVADLLLFPVQALHR